MILFCFVLGEFGGFSTTNIEEGEEKRPAIRPEIQKETEMEMLLNEITRATSSTRHDDDDARAGDDHAQQMQQMMHPAYDMHGHGANDDGISSSSHGLLDGHGRGAGYACQSPLPLASDGSSLCSLSGILAPADDDGCCRSSAGEDWTMEGLGLHAGLLALSIGDDREVRLVLPPASAPALADTATNPPLFRSGYGNSFLLAGASDDVYGAPWASVLPNSRPFDADERLCGSGLQQHCYVNANSFESLLEARRFGASTSHANGLHTAPENFICSGEAIAALGADFDYRGDQGLGFPSAFLHSPHNGVDLGRDLDALNFQSPRHAMLQTQEDYNLPCSQALPSLSRNRRNIEAFGRENGLITQGKGLDYVGNQWQDLLRGIPAANVGGVHAVPVPNFGRSPRLPLNYNNNMGIEGFMYHIAKDKQGCQLLERKLDEGRHQVDAIFNGIIDHMVELIVDPFGNYLVQKLLDVCSEEQRTRIIFMLTEDVDQFITISLNIFGSRAVEKLIETLKTRQQITLVVLALEPGLLDLIKDLNGHHVIQRCLQTFTAEDNMYIFYVAAKHCVDIATHRRGCYVLQRCISHSTGEHRRRLIAEISTNGLELAQDKFGPFR